MKLFRVFPWDHRSLASSSGGPFYIPRNLQGRTRHGLPEHDGVIYASPSAISAVAERLQAWRGSILTDLDFARGGDLRLALAEFELDDGVPLLDLHDPAVLAQRHINPADVATSSRDASQRLALRLFKEGAAGFLWWSSLDASWTNATLFESRVKKKLKLAGSPVPLSVSLPDVIEAARFLRIELG